MTENKRYFKKEYAGEYYIFDHEKISEKEFDEKLEYEDYKAFEDSMGGDEIVTLLNELSKENEQLKHDLKLYEKNNNPNEVLNDLRIELTSRLNDCIEEFKI